RFQFRATEKWVTSEPESLSSEFMIRRARLDFAGNLFNQNWNYRIQLAFSNLDMEPDRAVPLRDAYVTWSRFRDSNIRMGQMKVPFDRQRVTSSSALQMVDRSIVVDELNLDRDVGIQILSKDFLGLGRLTYQAGVFGGDGRNRTSDAPGVLWVGRLQFQRYLKQGGVAEAIFGGWEFSGITQARTGRQLTVSVTRSSGDLPDGNNSNQRPLRWGDVKLRQDGVTGGNNKEQARNQEEAFHFRVSLGWSSPAGAGESSSSTSWPFCAKDTAGLNLLRRRLRSSGHSPEHEATRCRRLSPQSMLLHLGIQQPPLNFQNCSGSSPVALGGFQRLHD
ncbi:MAG: hypothetical protein L0387_39965, partial [Acidobacteria bacterium]|nr:hypothetical protein [Acidobacteriota bacterium]